MSAVRTSERTDDVGRNSKTDRNPVRRLTTETKSALKTTEMIAFVVAVFGVLIASLAEIAGPAWRPHHERAWAAALDVVAGAMLEGAAAAELDAAA